MWMDKKKKEEEEVTYDIRKMIKEKNQERWDK